jgi:hypothetical protein
MFKAAPRGKAADSGFSLSLEDHVTLSRDMEFATEIRNSLEG